MFSDNLTQLRKLKRMTQEDIAEAVGVSRQAVAKWEAGETLPDLDKCRKLADLFEVTLDDLANYEPKENMGLGRIVGEPFRGHLSTALLSHFLRAHGLQVLHGRETQLVCGLFYESP